MPAVSDYLNQELYKSEFASLTELGLRVAGLYKNVPIEKSIKTEWMHETLITKSGWYACLVNNNIHNQFLTEYFQHKQTRNILLKKEAEEYLKEIEKFSQNSALSNKEFFESLFIINSEKKTESRSDLFSNITQVKKQACEPELEKKFTEWDKQDNTLTEEILHFFAWHKLDKYGFSNKRQKVIWLNFKLWKYWGNLTFILPIEEYLYKNILPKSEIKTQDISLFIEYLRTTLINCEQKIKETYRFSYHYEQFQPIEKIANNRFFDALCKTIIPSENILVDDIIKIIFEEISKKGFANQYDLKTIEKELVHNALLKLQEQEQISVMETNMGWAVFPFYPSTTNRLTQFNNTRDLSLPKINLANVISRGYENATSNDNVPILPISTERETNKQEDKKVRKVFFG